MTKSYKYSKLILMTEHDAATFHLNDRINLGNLHVRIKSGKSYRALREHRFEITPPPPGVGGI